MSQLTPDEYNKIVSSKPKSSYPKNILHAAELTKFIPTDEQFIFGSYIYRIQKYASDIDTREYYYKEGSSKKEVLDGLYKALLQVIKRLDSLPNVYITEWKSGQDVRYVVDIGYIDNGIYYINRNSIKREVDKLISEGLLPEDEIIKINQILSIPNENLTTYNYDELYNLFREHWLLRWSNEELKKKYKLLPGNKKITLKNSLDYFGDMKVDTIMYTNSKYLEVSNFIVIQAVDKKGNVVFANTPEGITPPDDLRELIIENVAEDAEKRLFSKWYFKPFKACKRFWSIARLQNDKLSVERLTPIVTGDLGYFSLIISDLSTIMLLLESTKYNVSVEKVNDELENIKDRLSRVLLISSSDDEKYNVTLNMIEEIKGKDNKKQKLKLLKELKSVLQLTLDDVTIQQMKKNHLYPYPPRNLLPKKLKYIPEYGEIIGGKRKNKSTKGGKKFDPYDEEPPEDPIEAEKAYNIYRNTRNRFHIDLENAMKEHRMINPKIYEEDAEAYSNLKNNFPRKYAKELGESNFYYDVDDENINNNEPLLIPSEEYHGHLVPSKKGEALLNNYWKKADKAARRNNIDEWILITSEFDELYPELIDYTDRG